MDLGTDLDGFDDDERKPAHPSMQESYERIAEL